MSEVRVEVQRHGTMYLVSSLLITFIGFFATIFYAHWIGADILGVYFIFISALNVLCVVSDFGIGYAGLQRLCEGKDPDRIFSAILGLKIILYILMIICLIVFQDFFLDIRNAGLFWVLLIVVGISMIQGILGTAVAATNRLGLAATSTLINNIVRIFFQVIAVFLGYAIYGLIGGLIAGIVVELLIELKYLDYHLIWFGWGQVKSIFSSSNWVFFSTIGNTLFENANLLIIAYFLPVSSVGIFGVCWTFSVFALFVSTALCNTLFVKVSRWNATGNVQIISQSLSRAITYALVFALPIFVGGLLFSQDLLYYLYGASFAGGATALVIIILMRVFQSAAQLYSNYLIATDHARQSFYGMGIGVGISLIIAFLLVPMVGIVGASIASLVNMVCSIVILHYYLKKVIPIKIEHGPVLHIIFSTVVMALVLLVFKLIPLSESYVTLGAMIMAGATVYFIVLFRIDRQIWMDFISTINIQWILK